MAEQLRDLPKLASLQLLGSDRTGSGKPQPLAGLRAGRTGSGGLGGSLPGGKLQLLATHVLSRSECHQHSRRHGAHRVPDGRALSSAGPQEMSVAAGPAARGLGHTVSVERVMGRWF